MLQKRLDNMPKQSYQSVFPHDTVYKYKILYNGI